MTFHAKVFQTFSVLLGVIMLTIGIILGQIFPFLVQQAVDTNIDTKLKEASAYMEEYELTPQEQFLLKEALQSEFIERDIRKEKESLWYFLFFVLLFVYIISLIIGFQFCKKYAQPVEHVTETAMELAKGHYHVRAYENNNSGMSKLTNSINILARNLQEISMIRKTEQERLKTLIENMVSGLIMIDRNGNVTIINRAFLAQLDMSDEDVRNKQFKTIGLPDKIEKFIDDLFLTETSQKQQINIRKGLHNYSIVAYGAPVIGEHGRWLGIVVVVHDITELVKLEQIRKDFVANVSHELKTPITSIKGFAETLLLGAYKKEENLLSFLEIIYKESNRLQMLINDLLDLSKVEQEGYTMNIAKVKLYDVVVSCLEMTNHLLEEKDMDVELNLNETTQVKGDYHRIIQIMMNLLTNAISYSGNHTTIHINIGEKGSYGYLQIRDEGIGIKQEEQERIFERFYRVDRARSRESGGTGLGLAIVKHLVEAHHGYIELESEVGKGTQFTVYIPKA